MYPRTPELRLVVDLPAARVAQLDRIERHLVALRVQEGIAFMEIDDRLADLAAAEDTNTSKLARLIADFESRGTLTDDQRAAFDAIKSEIVGNAASIDAADPEATPAPVEPPADTTPPADAGDGQPDGSTVE